MGEASNTFAYSEKTLDIYDGRYYIINKRILTFVGQWPYQSLREGAVRTVLLTLLTITLLVPQVLKLLTSWDDIDIFIECLSPTITNIGFSIKLVNLMCNKERIKNILDETRDNWNYMRRYSNEYKILQKYGEKGRLCTLCYTILINLIVVAWICVPMITIIMDIIIPLNYTRPRLSIFQADYKVDPNEYFFPIFFHGSIVCLAGLQLYVSNDTLYMALSQHACGMIEILRYRLENIIQDEGTVGLDRSPSRDRHYYRSIVSCIKRHIRVVEYVRLLESTCEWLLVISLFLNGLVMSCTSARTVAKGTAPQDVMRFAFFTIAQITHLFCNTLPGHWIMEASSQIQNSAYSCRWYLMSPNSSKLLILLIRRCLTPCTITAGKIYVMSMENFCGVLKTAMSYCTMLTSMQ